MLSNSSFRIIRTFLIAEIFFLGIFLLPHKDWEIVFIINLNLYYLIGFFLWINLRSSQINKTLITILALGYSINAVTSILGFFEINLITTNFIFYYNLLTILFAVIDLFTVIYLLVLAISPQSKDKIKIFIAINLSILLSILIYRKILFYNLDLNASYLSYNYNYVIYIINLSFLVVFWIQFTINKLMFSEYISNVITVYTIVIALEVLYMFSVQNNGLLHELGQYFTAALHLVLIALLIVRLQYLQSPESAENEHYIKNYMLLQGIVDKPRNGIIYELYTRLNRTTAAIFLLLLFLIILYIFYSNQFQVFIKLNLLILIVAIIISAILAITNWYKRWYDSIGFFFKKRRK
jgi:hypothetical protein